ncbi:MAG: hypothetical protein HC883_00175 [Bdellovibrionaceae bacterium]|nr:hypothetical protein [Pseudobdellovibrionaceae bacterium]
MNSRTDEFFKQRCIKEFEKYFGPFVQNVYWDTIGTALGHEAVLVIENKSKRAFYSSSGELIKVINLTGQD